MRLRFDFSRKLLDVWGITAACVAAGDASAKPFQILYTFQDSKDGDSAHAGLVGDDAGNLYGTTFYGDTSLGDGTAFKLAPDGTKTILHSFSGGTDGGLPAGLIIDKAGNLFGTTQQGGRSGGCNGNGCGVVFELATNGTESQLYTFTGGADGAYPMGSLLPDGKGGFFGTANGGGADRLGTVFALSKAGALTVLHTFAGGSDGDAPIAGLIADKAGNLYGTTKLGGAGCSGFGCGTVYEIAADGTGTVLYAFTGGSDGGNPVGGLIADAAGNLYGTTEFGGSGKGCGGTGCRTVFRLAPGGALTVLYTFTGGSDGAQPVASLIKDAKGNLYGTTLFGGTGYGVAFKIAARGKERVLHSFTNGDDGAYPWGALFKDGEGSVVSTASGGGSTDFGTVFRIGK